MRTVIFATLFKAAAFITVVLAILTFIQWAGGDAGEDAGRLLRLTSISFASSVFFKLLDILFNKKEEEKE